MAHGLRASIRHLADPVRCARQVRIVGAQYASNAATGWQTRPWKYGAYGEAMRQYTSNGRLPGYNGPLDLNVFRSEAWQWDKYASPNGAAKPSQPTPQPQVDTIDWNALADKAIRGDFGNSEARKAALGDKYAKVQSIVNQRLGGATTTAAPAPVASTTSVRVCSGDTISGIAVRTGLWPVTAWRVPSGNINLIYPGNIVTYRSTASSASSGSVATGGRVHVVNSGETLSGIFGANGWQRVAQLNNLANPNLTFTPARGSATDHNHRGLRHHARGHINHLRRTIWIFPLRPRSHPGSWA